jgi:hypothetical protein
MSNAWSKNILLLTTGTLIGPYLFRQEIDFFSLDKVGSEADVNSMVRTFTEAILGARSTAVLLVRPNRYHLTLTPQIRSIIPQKNERRRAWQRHHNTGLYQDYQEQVWMG